MKTKYLSLCLLSLAAIGIMFVVNGYRYVGSYAQASAVEVVRPSIDGDVSTVGPIRNLRFTLFDAGIRPSEMRIKAGLVNILIEDKTHASQGVTIHRVVDTDRVAVGVVAKAVNGTRGRNSLLLTAGKYELYDAHRPANKAVLLVTP